MRRLCCELGKMGNETVRTLTISLLVFGGLKWLTHTIISEYDSLCSKWNKIRRLLAELFSSVGMAAMVKVCGGPISR